MSDPYKILGVSPDASDEDVKKAYLKLARKYHPDKYTDTDLADLAAEKMKEVNAAYEEIRNMRAQGQSQSGYSYGTDATGSSGDAVFARVRHLINSGVVGEAFSLLENVPISGRNAEWHFLRGCVEVRSGHFSDATYYLDMACQMDPGNVEYRMARDRFRQHTMEFGRDYQPAGRSCCCDLCSALICLDCLCSPGRC